MNSQIQKALTVRHLHTWVLSDDDILKVIDDVSFSLKKGKCLVLLGESGSGKSMTALSLMRLLPESADVIFGRISDQFHDNWLNLPEKQFARLRGKKIGMIFQEPALALNPIMSIGKQIEEVLIQHTNLSRQARYDWIIELLDWVGIKAAKTRMDDYPFMLSGGMKQRVMIAMALAGEPDILIADEPTTALDVTVQSQVLELLCKIKQERQMAILLITHDLGVTSLMADDVAVMYQGKIVDRANRSDFFNHIKHPYTKKLFSALPSMATRGKLLPTEDRVVSEDIHHDKVNVDASSHESWHTLIDDLVHQPVRFQNKAEEIVSEPTLVVSNLSVFFPIKRGIFRSTVGYSKAVNSVSLSLYPGRTTVLVGESGCGKTTVGKAIVRLLVPTSGRILLDGQDTQTLTKAALNNFRKRVQMVFQDPFGSLNPRMRIRDILSEAMDAVGMLVTEEKLMAALQSVTLQTAGLDRYPHEFSGGQRQRIAIARAMAVEPNVIVCDEPTSALDMSTQAQILNLLNTLQQERQLSYLFITHNWAVVEHLADDIVVMYAGNIVEYGQAIQLLENAQHPYTQCLMASVPKIGEVIDGQQFTDQLNAMDTEQFHIDRACPFALRCPKVQQICKASKPTMCAVTEKHFVACHLIA